MDYILASLDLAIEPEGQYPLTNQKASVFQGILMQEIDADYAEQLHQSQLHPIVSISFPIKKRQYGGSILWTRRRISRLYFLF